LAGHHVVPRHPAGRMSEAAVREHCICILASSWGGNDERALIQQQLVTGLASRADVHLLLLGEMETCHPSGPSLSVHHFASPLDALATVRRDLLVAKFSVPSSGSEFEKHARPSHALDSILPAETESTWRSVGQLMLALEPTVVVVLDHRDRGVLTALEGLDNIPVVLIPLADSVSTPARAYYDALFHRVHRCIVFSQAERQKVGVRQSLDIASVKIPVVVDAGQWTTASNDVPLLLVLSDVDARDRLGRKEFATLVAQANPGADVQVVGKDTVTRWVNGLPSTPMGIQSEAELLDLMGRASVVVDLHPGRLIGWQTIQALQLGTPVVVPRASRPREVVDAAGAGLWFSTAGELLWSVEALLDPTLSQALGQQGRAYCKEHHGSFARFANQLFDACLNGASEVDRDNVTT